MYMLTVLETSVNGCTGDTLELVVMVGGYNLELGEDPLICEGEDYSIDLTGQFDNYLWNDGSTGASYITSTEGWITLLVTDSSGCSVSDSVFLTVNPLPVVDLGPDTSLCSDQGFVLDAGTDGVIYTWSTGDITQEITVFQGASQEIIVVVEDEHGCSSSDTIVIGQCDPEFYFRDIPTAITPNNDGTNDTWIIEKLSAYSQAEVEIFNRWGTLVWKSEPGYSTPWDGTDMNGNDMPMDSYHYVIKLNMGENERISGTVTVIR
jgi:gliding motility-associated-like protein